MLSQWHMGAALFHYTGQVAHRFGDSGSLEEWKWCHNVMVEADIHFRPLHASILSIYKVFEPLVCCLKGIWVHPYSVTLARLAPDLGTQVHLRSENDAITLWLRLISMHLWLQLFHASAHAALQHREVLPHHNPIWRTNLPFLVKPLAKVPLIAHHELVIAITHCEHDLVQHTLIDPKPCKFCNVVEIDLTFPIV